MKIGKFALALLLTTALSAPALANDDAKVLARVNDSAITRADLNAELKALPPQLQQMPVEAFYPQLLEQMIVERVVRAEALKAGLETDAEVQKRVTDAKDKIVADEYLRRAVEKNTSDRDLKKAYDKYKADFKSVTEVRASHILVKSEDEAKALIKQIADGADFAKLATEKSADKGAAARGGDLGFFKQGDMVEAFEKAAFAMKKGDVSKTPVQTEFGWHVIKITETRKTEPQSFDAMKPQLQAQLSQQAAQKVVQDLLQKAKVERFKLDGSAMTAPSADKAKN